MARRVIEAAPEQVVAFLTRDQTVTLPDCMMPDGADPCGGYHELRAENERLTTQNKELRDAMMQCARIFEAVARTALESKPAIAPCDDAEFGMKP